MAESTAPPRDATDGADDAVTPDLAALAAAHGVATEHRGWRGDLVQARRATLVAVLGALGVDATTPDAVRAALGARDHARSTRVLPPVVVTREGRAATFAANPPPGTRLELWIELEDGGVRRDITTTPAASGDAHALPADLPLGWHTIHARALPETPASLGSGGATGIPHPTTHPTSHPTSLPAPTAETAGTAVPLAVTPARLAPPTRRTWGWMVQLYSLLSRRSWGIGDLADLSELAAWSARTHGAGFILVNPLHAASPVTPVEASPYLPTSRRYTDPLYLRVEDVPEFAYLTPVERAVAEELQAESRTAGPHPGRLNRDAVREAKREALALVHRMTRSPGREAEFRAFTAREGERLRDHAVYCALADEHGADWRTWPPELRDPASPAVDAARERLAGQVDFHMWTQWVADGQLAAAQRTARDAGMPVGIVHDLAVGVDPGGSDAWALGSERGGRTLALGASGGAPPDAMNPVGQDWSQPPWHPVRLAEAGYAPYRDLLRAAFRHAGAVRVDHVLGLFRFWWVPEGNSPADGAYVRYDHEAMVGILALEAHRAGATVIGEDLGTVEPWVRDYLAERGILGTSVLWFEHGPDGGPADPETWRPLSLATVTTHDLPPTAARLAGEHVGLWERLGLLTGDTTTAREEDAAEREAWLDVLRLRGLLRPGAGERETVEALYRLLVRAPSAMLGVWLPDAVGDRRPQNVPGTYREYPNWLLPVADGQSRQVLLEDFTADPRAASLARVFRTLAAD